MPISCVIVAYRNTEQELNDCLESLVGQPIGEIVLVDNNSPQHQSFAIRNGLRYLPLSGNRGFAYAANRGGMIAKGEYIFFLNPDAKIIAGDLRDVIQQFVSSPRVGIIGLTLIDKAGQIEPFGFGSPVTPCSLFLRKVLPPHPFFNSQRPPFLVAWVSGGALLVRSQLFLDLLGFDETFFMYWEDVDFCRRATKAGSTVLLNTSLRVLHHKGTSPASQQERTKHYNESADKYFKKHYSKPLWLFQNYSRRCYRFIQSLLP